MQQIHRLTRVRLDWLRLSIHLIGSFYLFELTFNWLNSGLGANPIQFVEQHLGRELSICW